MPRKYPPLATSEVIANLIALGFAYSHTKGGHFFYKANHSGRNWKVTVDPNDSPFGEFLLRSMIAQSGYSREQFYCATKRTAKKIGMSHSDEETEHQSGE